MTSNEYLQGFKNVLQVKYPDSFNTHKTYMSMLSKFLNEFRGNIQRASKDDLIEYLATIKGNSQKAQMHGVLKNFYAYVLDSPLKFKYIPTTKKEHRLPFAPQHEQVMEMIQDETNLKHKAILMFFYGTGIRLSELTEARWKDIQRVKGENPLQLHIRGKGKKDRVVPLSQNVFNILSQYCKEYQLNSKCKECYIFEGVNGGRYSNRSAHEVVKRAGKKYGLQISPHKLRHSCFRTLRGKGVDLAAIQKLAGHADIKTSGMYADMLPQKIEMPI